MDSSRPAPPEPLVWQITLLGSLRAVRKDNLAVDSFQTHRTALLLAMLAYYRERIKERDCLAERIWSEVDILKARRSLAQAASWLRKHLEPEGMATHSVLITNRRYLYLDPGLISVDVAAFENAVRLVDKSVIPVERAALLGKAAALYTGELLPGFYEDWVVEERRRLQDTYLRIVHELIIHHEKAGEKEAAIGYADAALVAAPHAKEAHEDRIRLLAANGYIAAAIQQYDALERMLARDGNDRASNSIRDLVGKLRTERSDITVPKPAASPLPGGKLHRAVLPLTLTRFFGREEYIERISTLISMESTRLITLTGIGGSGKTRLAVETARRLLLHFKANIVFIPLADINDPSLIATTIREGVRRTDTDGQGTLSSEGGPSAWDYLVERLSRAPYLLVLDNLEHLQNTSPIIDGNSPAQIIRRLLEEIPTLTILATSRQRLMLEGEQDLPLLPLSIPLRSHAPANRTIYESDFSAASVQMFVDRARVARPDFQINDKNAAIITQICAQLEGLPLAIELCAAWAQVLPPAQMLARLERRFSLLVSRHTDTKSRHRTLWDTIEYSYQMLPVRQQRLFACLCVFNGGWSLEAAGAVINPFLIDSGLELEGELWFAFLSALTDICERSLVVVEEHVETGNLRYRMLETLREFAREQLSDSDLRALHRQHAVWFLSLAERVESNLSGPEQAEWLALLEVEHDNLRAALNWAAKEDIRIGLRLASALTPFWDMRGHMREGREILNGLLTRTESDRGNREDDLIFAKAWSAMGRLCWCHGDFTEAKVAHERALALWRQLGAEQKIARCLHDLGATAMRLGLYTESRLALEESLVFARVGGDAADVARAYNNLGNIAGINEQPELSREFYRQSLEAAESKGDRQLIATALHNLGTAAGEQKDYVEAERLFQQALVLRQELRDDYGVMTTMLNLGKTAWFRQELRNARNLMTQAMNLAHQTGRKLVLAYCIKDLGLVTLREGNIRDGVRQLAAAIHLYEVLSASIFRRHRDECDQALDMARENLGQEAYQEAWEAGRAVTALQVIEELRQINENEPSLPMETDTGIHCPYCGEDKLLRHGRAPNGKQRFRCASCRKSTRTNPGTSAYPDEMRERILAARQEGASLRELARRFGISRNTVLAWVHAATAKS